MQIAVLGVDLGKNSCSVVVLDTAGRVVLRRRLHRDSVIKLAAGLAPCVVAMEACCSVHHLGRLLLCGGMAQRRADLDGDHGEHGAVAAAPPNGRPPADAFTWTAPWNASVS
jgi:hypothetical protein